MSLNFELENLKAQKTFGVWVSSQEKGRKARWKRFGLENVTQGPVLQSEVFLEPALQKKYMHESMHSLKIKPINFSDIFYFSSHALDSLQRFFLLACLKRCTRFFYTKEERGGKCSSLGTYHRLFPVNIGCCLVEWRALVCYRKCLCLSTALLFHSVAPARSGRVCEPGFHEGHVSNGWVGTPSEYLNSCSLLN